MATPTEYLRVSYSSLNTAASCWRKFEFHKLYPRIASPWDDDNYAADVGKALHAGFQGYLTHGNREQAIWEFMLAFPYEAEFSQDNDYRSFEASLATLEEMFDESKLQEYELAMIRRPSTPAEIASGIIDGVVVPAIEVPFSIRFNGLTLPDGRGIEFIGFIDAIMRHHMTGLFRSLDIKTTRMNTKDSTGKFIFDSQQTPYGLVIEHIAGQPVEQFEVLYLDSYIDIVEPRAVFYPFMRSRTDIEEWVANRVIQFQSLIRFMELGYFPRTDGGCMFYNKPCKYLEPCMSRDREALIHWFTLGAEVVKDKDADFMPWIVAEIEVGGI